MLSKASRSVGASSLDHGTLCQLGHLKEGNPDELASQYVDIRTAFPQMNVFGGCCGTDYVHVEKIPTDPNLPSAHFEKRRTG
jgi:S-methylmethionine-dependent homocysteine/selenocysteine methylase